MLYTSFLSTPHGTLGTWLKVLLEEGFLEKPFNSTRYIRNILYEVEYLSKEQSFNSTRYIRNTGNALFEVLDCQLSTPHGTLGTLCFFLETRLEGFKIFQLHTVH